MSEYIYGRRPVFEALRAGSRTFQKIWIEEGTHGTEEILKLARERGVPMDRARKGELNKRAGGNHQGFLAQVSGASYQDLEGFLAHLPEQAPATIVALDELQDPHNVGAILRSAGFFGVSAAIVPKWRSAPVGETAARVSSGAIDHVPLIRVTNLASAVLTLKEAGFEVIGTDTEGAPLEKHEPTSRTALIFGNEEEGIRRLVRERCDKLLKITGGGPVESLNVGAAAAIFLHHFCRGSR